MKTKQWFKITFKVLKGWTSTKRYGSKRFFKGRVYTVRRKAHELDVLYGLENSVESGRMRLLKLERCEK